MRLEKRQEARPTLTKSWIDGSVFGQVVMGMVLGRVVIGTMRVQGNPHSRVGGDIYILFATAFGTLYACGLISIE